MECSSVQNIAHLYIWTTLRSESPVYLLQKLFETWVLLWTPITPWCPVSTIKFKNPFLKSGGSLTTIDIWQKNHPKLQSTLMLRQDLIIAIVCYMNCLKNCLKMQNVMNTAARWVTRTRKFDYITPVLVIWSCHQGAICKIWPYGSYRNWTLWWIGPLKW